MGYQTVGWEGGDRKKIPIESKVQQNAARVCHPRDLRDDKFPRCPERPDLCLRSKRQVAMI